MKTEVAPERPSEPVPTTQTTNELSAGQLRLPQVLMQAVGHIAPAIGTVTTLAFIASLSGVVAPIAFLLGGVICLLVAISISQLATKISGAGGFFTYVSNTFGPRAGFLTSWAYFLYDPLVTGVLLAFAGSVVHDSLEAHYGWGPQWWMFLLAGWVLIGTTSWFGLKISTRLLIFLGVAEMTLFGALALTGLINPGPGGFSLAPFDPGNASVNGLYLGVVFTILAYTGFESVAPLAEETENPRRNLPIAMIASIIGLVIFYVLESWGMFVGWGINDIPGFAASGAPVFDLADRLWGDFWVLTLCATITSVLALTIATHNAATRVFFSMGRAGALPRSLAKVDDTHRTPTNAIILQSAITLVGGIGISLIVGPQESFFLVGLVLTLSLILVYGVASMGTFRLYRRRYPSEFNPFLHAVVPLVGTAALLWVGYKSVEELNIFDPQQYLDWAPAILVGWLALGGAVLIAFRLIGHDSWLLEAERKLEDELEEEPPADVVVSDHAEQHPWPAS